MRMRFLPCALLLMSLPAWAQPAPPPMKLFTAAADIPGLIAKAKAAQKSPTVNSTQPIARFGGTSVLLEYRTGVTPPTVHPGQSELVYVIEGNATLVTGGKLIGAGPANPGATTVSGTSIEGTVAPQNLPRAIMCWFHPLRRTSFGTSRANS